MSTERVGGYPNLDLPDDFETSTSWERATEESTTIEPYQVVVFDKRMNVLHRTETKEGYA